MSNTLTPAVQLAEKARTPFPGASGEYDNARRALLAEESNSAATSPAWHRVAVVDPGPDA